MHTLYVKLEIEYIFLNSHSKRKFLICFLLYWQLLSWITFIHKYMCRKKSDLIIWKQRGVCGGGLSVDLVGICCEYQKSWLESDFWFKWTRHISPEVKFKNQYVFTVIDNQICETYSSEIVEFWCSFFSILIWNGAKEISLSKEIWDLYVDFTASYGIPIKNIQDILKTGKWLFLLLDKLYWSLLN